MQAEREGMDGRGAGPSGEKRLNEGSAYVPFAVRGRNNGNVAVEALLQYSGAFLLHFHSLTARRSRSLPFSLSPN